VVIKVRLRAYGDKDEQIAEFDRDWRSKHPDWNTADKWAGLSISTRLPEIWMDLRETKDGLLVVPVHVLGHEFMHVVEHKATGAINPDTFTGDIY